MSWTIDDMPVMDLCVVSDCISLLWSLSITLNSVVCVCLIGTGYVLNHMPETFLTIVALLWSP